MNFELVSVDNDFFCWALDLNLDLHRSFVAKGVLKFKIVQ